MNKVDKALEELLAALYKDPLIIDFQNAKSLVENDPFVKETEEKLKKLQQQMTQNVMNKELHHSLKVEYDGLKKDFDEHPYVLNYNSLLNEVNELLLNLKTIIE